MVAFIWTFFLIFLNAYLTADTARRRGRSVNAWAWLGLIFGPFAWLAVALLPAIRNKKSTGNAR